MILLLEPQGHGQFSSDRAQYGQQNTWFCGHKVKDHSLTQDPGWWHVTDCSFDINLNISLDMNRLTSFIVKKMRNDLRFSFWLHLILMCPVFVRRFLWNCIFCPCLSQTLVLYTLKMWTVHESARFAVCYFRCGCLHMHIVLCCMKKIFFVFGEKWLGYIYFLSNVHCYCQASFRHTCYICFAIFIHCVNCILEQNLRGVVDLYCVFGQPGSLYQIPWSAETESGKFS